MEITEEFMEKSIVAEYILDFAKEESKDFNSEEFFGEIMNCFFKDLEKYCNILLQIIESLKNKKYPEARQDCRLNDDFVNLTDDIRWLRATLKSLLTGLIKTSAIIGVVEIEYYKNSWKSYSDLNKNIHSYDYHHFVVYQQFKEVNTLEELQKFNEFFHHYLVEMAFKMCEIFFRRMNYTIEYLQNDEAFKDVCREATVNLNNFRNEIEKLKRVPLFINHRGTENT